MSEGVEAQSLAHGFKFDAQEGRLRCMPHTVHLAAIEVNGLTDPNQTCQLLIYVL
jgi:hypothetical protein